MTTQNNVSVPQMLLPCSKSGASKSRPRWAAHTCIGMGVPPPPRVVTPLPDLTEPNFVWNSRKFEQVYNVRDPWP